MANLVQNPGFELGNVNWTLFNASIVNNAANAHTGSWYAATNLFIIPTSAFIEQSGIPTIAGAQYIFSFWVNPLPVANSITVTINGVPIANVTADVLKVYTRYTFPFTATSASSTLRITIFRGAPLINNAWIDDVSIVPVVICFSGESKVHTLNTQNNNIQNIPAIQIDPKIHQVYSVNNQKFIPILKVPITKSSNRMMLIKKDSLGTDKPFEDFYITSGHKIMYNSEIIKAKYIPGAKKIKVKNQPVYTIVTDIHEPILINGLDVMTFGLEEWNNNPLSRL